MVNQWIFNGYQLETSRPEAVRLEPGKLAGRRRSASSLEISRPEAVRLEPENIMRRDNDDDDE